METAMGHETDEEFAARQRARGPIHPPGTRDMTSPLDESCPHCGEAYEPGEAAEAGRHGPLQCPECGREGCSLCMPAGRRCLCPECEEHKHDDSERERTPVEVAASLYCGYAPFEEAVELELSISRAIAKLRSLLRSQDSDYCHAVALEASTRRLAEMRGST